MEYIEIKDIHADRVSLGSYKLRGWIRTFRSSKSVSFIDLNDGSSLKGAQLVLAADLPGIEDLKPKLHTGSAIAVEGDLVASPAKGQKYEFQVRKLELVGAADETYPLQKKGHTLEFLREILHLRPRSNTFGAVFRTRSQVSLAVHNFFAEHGFVYLHSPIITSSDCEGAGEMFRVTTIDPASPPRDEKNQIDYSRDFFGAEASLSVSGQLEGEIFATALGKIYTFGPTFRAENSNTTRHLSEFWMIEPEVAFNSLEDNMKLAENFIKSLISKSLANCRDDLEFLHAREWCPKDILQTLELVLNKPVEVLTYTEAIGILEKSGKKFDFPVNWGIDLQTEHERYLTDEYVKGPLFVIDYPKDIKAFYMRLNDDGKTVRAMDMLVPRLGEIIGGSQREERPDVLLEKIRTMKLPEENYWWYLDLRRFGTVPHAGFGLGFERFLMYLTGMQNIRDVIPFPRFPGFAKF